MSSLEAERARHRRRPRPRVRRALLPAALLALLVALVPLGLLAANPFTDLNPGSVHNANIEAIFNAGITTGCVPPPDPRPEYCPNRNVTREEMASFLARLGGLGSNPPVANAKTAQTATNAQTAQTALAVANGTITPAAFSPAGSVDGQVLTSTGGSVTWQTPQTPVRSVKGLVLANGTIAAGTGFTVTVLGTPNSYRVAVPAGTFGAATPIALLTGYGALPFSETTTLNPDGSASFDVQFAAVVNSFSFAFGP